MKFIMVGRPDIEIQGIWLTPTEYLRHEAYHGMVKSIEEPCLFIAHHGERGWRRILPSYSTTFQLIDATEEEQIRLWVAGYRMLGLDRPGAPRCRNCNKPMGEGETFYGPKMWHCDRPTCGHGEIIHCPSCGENWDNLKCPKCGCGELYC